MPNTKSAARRARQSTRRHQHNRSVKSRLKTVERNYEEAVSAGKKDEAVAALKSVTSALAKAAKVGAIHRATASRKTSRLARQLAKLK